MKWLSLAVAYLPSLVIFGFGFWFGTIYEKRKLTILDKTILATIRIVLSIGLLVAVWRTAAWPVALMLTLLGIEAEASYWTDK